MRPRNLAEERAQLIEKIRAQESERHEQEVADLQAEYLRREDELRQVRRGRIGAAALCARRAGARACAVVAQKKDALMAQPEPDRGEVKELQKQIGELRQELRAKVRPARLHPVAPLPRARARARRHPRPPSARVLARSRRPGSRSRKAWRAW
jgi:hypothetical protein